MTGFEIYSETIKKLTEELSKVKNEVIELRIKNSNLIGKLEVYEKLNGNDFKLNPVQNSPSLSYDDLLRDYVISNDSELVSQMFNLTDKPTTVLQDIRDILPPNIDELAVKFNCVEELEILRRSKKAIDEWVIKDNFYSIMPLSDIVDNYIICYNKDKKRLAYKYMRLAILHYPFDFNIFESKIKEYKYEDFDSKILKMKEELYGNEENENIKKEKKPRRKTTSHSFKRGDYRVKSIDQLFEYVMSTPNTRQTALRVLKNMKVLGERSEDDIETLRLEINEHLTKKIGRNECG